MAYYSRRLRVKAKSLNRAESVPVNIKQELLEKIYVFGRFLSSLKRHSDNDQMPTRRRYSRRNCDRCVSVIGGTTYPVENWSMGGLKITGDDRMFSTDQELDITIKFRLRNEILDVPHKARIVRKAKNRIAFEFLPLSQKIRNNFQQVVDDYVARKFADSQSA